MKNVKNICFTLAILLAMSASYAQTTGNSEGQVIHISKLSLDKKKKETFQSRDSILTVYIDTLIMKDKSALQFYGKKAVNLYIKHADIGKEVVVYGQGLRNNGTNFQIDIDFEKLNSLYILARGQDAMNGTKTFPNGDGGNVTLTYAAQGFVPQTTNKKAKHYIHIDITEGGLHVTPSADLNNIYTRIASSPIGLRGLPQGQIYSGSAGKRGTVLIKNKEIDSIEE